MGTTHFSGPVAVGSGSITELSAAKTITANENGSTFVFTGIVGYAVTLPAPAAGLRYKFIVQDLFATTDWVLTSASANMQGSVMEAGAIQAVASATTINLELAADTIGDFLTAESDGTNWYIFGSFVQAASVTPA